VRKRTVRIRRKRCGKLNRKEVLFLALFKIIKMNFMRSDGREMARKESEARKLMETLSSSFKRDPLS
jgi:hypothetical protein